MRHRLFKWALAALRHSRADQLLRPWSSGMGLIFTLHRVRPKRSRRFQPNEVLEITPDYLEQVLQELRQKNIPILTLDEAAAQLSEPRTSPFFACFTIDDAYWDIQEYAAPLFKKYEAPYTLFVVPGFAARTHGPWWNALEEIVASNEAISVLIDGQAKTYMATTDQEKDRTFKDIYETIRYGSHEQLIATMEDLAGRYGLSMPDIAASECMNWEALRETAADPLVTIGAHTMSHAILARLSTLEVKQELEESRSTIARELGVTPRHFAYPVGDPTSADIREFRLASEAGYTSAVTTRPGMLFPDYKNAMHSLPRVSLNGHFQCLNDLRSLMTGVPFLVFNRGRFVV